MEIIRKEFKPQTLESISIKFSGDEAVVLAALIGALHREQAEETVEKSNRGSLVKSLGINVDSTLYNIFRGLDVALKL